MAMMFSRLRRLLRRLFLATVFLALMVAYVWYDRHAEQSRRITDAAGARIFVADGDTVRIGTRTIRLAGIDAVELKQFCKAADGAQWSCGLRARDALEALVRAGGLTCRQIATDKYQRAVATCATTQTPDLGAAMVEAGWAINEDDRDSGGYALEESRAARDKRGIWAGTFEEPVVWRTAHAVPSAT